MGLKWKELSVGDIVSYDSNHQDKYLEVVEIQNSSVFLKFLKSYRGQEFNHGQVGRTKIFGNSSYQTGIWALEQNYTLVESKKEGLKVAEDKILWKVIGEEKYGTRVGINAEGHYVLDLNGAYAAYPKEKLEEVIPYTIGIRELTRDLVIHYQAKKDFFVLGDILRWKGKLYVVDKLDTKARGIEKSIKEDEVEFLVFEKRKA